MKSVNVPSGVALKVRFGHCTERPQLERSIERPNVANS